MKEIAKNVFQIPLMPRSGINCYVIDDILIDSGIRSSGDSVMIVGDALVNMNLITTLVGLNQPPNAFTTDKKRNIESIKRIYDLKPKILCFGHGPVLFDNGELENFVKKIR